MKGISDTGECGHRDREYSICEHDKIPKKLGINRVCVPGKEFPAFCPLKDVKEIKPVKPRRDKKKCNYYITCSGASYCDNIHNITGFCRGVSCGYFAERFINH